MPACLSAASSCAIFVLAARSALEPGVVGREPPPFPPFPPGVTNDPDEPPAPGAPPPGVDGASNEPRAPPPPDGVVGRLANSSCIAS